MRTAIDAWCSWSVTALTSVTVGLGGVDGLAQEGLCGRSGDHAYCHTRTIADLASLHLPTCLGWRSTNCERAKAIVECACREYGLPRGARSAGHERPGRSPCAVVRSSHSDFSLRIDGGASQRIATDAGAHHSGEVAT